MLKKVEDIHIDKGIRLRTRMWLPEKPLAVLQCLHGMMEHSERYGYFAEWMADKGIAVFTHDHRGHGYSAKSDERTGYFAKKDGWIKILNDVEILRKKFTAGFPDIPYILLGHSMGSLIARDYLKEFGQNLNGLILSGTVHQPRIMLSLGKFLADISVIFSGERKRSRLLSYLTYEKYSSHFRPKRTEFDWLCSNNEIVDRYVEDPLCGERPTNSFYRDLLNGAARISTYKELSAINKDLPILFISGKDDPLGNFGKGPEFVARSYRKHGFNKVDLKLYENGRHEMLNEKRKEVVYKDIYKWIMNDVIKK